MSNCRICGTVEYWHAAGKGAMATPYCPQCNPPSTVVLPLDVGKDWDIDENEIHGMPPPVDRGGNAATGPADPGYPNDLPCPPADLPLYTFDDDPSPADFSIVGAAGKATSLSVDGSKVITAYDELPDTASQGQMAVRKGEDITYVFDGEEWQNLGEALLGKKRNVLTPRDEKINRRAAIAATKAKNAE